MHQQPEAAGDRAAQLRGDLRGLPPGCITGLWPADPTVPAAFYRWGVLAFLTPVLEQTNVFNALNFSFPVYVHTSTFPGTGIAPPNTTVVGTIVGLFLCPSDRMQKITTTDGFLGRRGPGLRPVELPFLRRRRRQRRRRDDRRRVLPGQRHDPRGRGHRRPVEHRLREREPARAGGRGYDPEHPGVVRANSADLLFWNAAWQGTATASINPANCLAATSLSTERMASWVDGTYTYGLYDHHYTPNSTSFDCITVLHDAQGNNLALSMGWKAARSRHPGGANVLFGDGSVHFVKNSIDGGTWAAVGTRAGGEVISSPF